MQACVLVDWLKNFVGTVQQRLDNDISYDKQNGRLGLVRSFCCATLDSYVRKFIQRKTHEAGIFTIFFFFVCGTKNGPFYF